MNYLTKIEAGEEIGQTKNGRKKSTWFWSTPDGYATGLRYGQRKIVLGGKEAFLIGTADDLRSFYEGFKESVQQGKLDAVLLKLQENMGRGKKAATEKEAA
jgi:hypothetical protein